MNTFVRIMSGMLGLAGGKLQKAHLRLTVGPRLWEVQRWVADRGDLRLRLDYPLTAEDVVWDVGAFEGQWASDISAKFGCTVHAFEPMPDFSAVVRNRLGRNPRITVHDFGLGATDASVMMTAADDGSSHVKPAARADRASRFEVRIRDVRHVFKELGARKVTLLKLNIEGAEYELLEAMIAGGLMSHFDYLQIQFHDFVVDAASRRDAIVAALAVTHHRTWCYPFVWENWTRRK